MDRKSFISENQKNNQFDSNLKFNKLKKRQFSIEKLAINTKINKKKVSILQFLFNKQDKALSTRKVHSREKDSTFYTKANHLPPLNLNTVKNSPKKQLQTINYESAYDIPQPDINEKENVISQLLSEKNEKNIKKKELNDLRKKYKKLKDNNLTYKVIIEKILNIEDDGVEDDEMNNNDIYKEIKKINKKDKGVINALKRQILDYDKSIEEKNKILEETKKEERINNFININKLINEKNRELESLVVGSQELQYFQNDMDNRVDFLISSIKKYKESSSNLKDKLKINEKDISFNESIIQENIKEKEDIKNKIEKLEKERKKLEDEKMKRKEIIKGLVTEYDKIIEYQKEKEKIENNIKDLYKLENNIKKTLEKNETKIILLKKNNNSLQNELSITEKDKKYSSDNIKQNIKIKEDIKKYEKEIKQMKEEIEKNKLIEKKLIIQKEQEDKRIKKEIEEFEKARINLLNKIIELNKELTERTNLNIKKEEELSRTNKEYDNISKAK